MPLPHWEATGDSPWHQATRWSWHKFIQCASERRICCEDDIFQYYAQFLELSNPLAEAGCLTAEERNIGFWYGFHPDDQQELESRLLLDYSRLYDISFEEVFEITYSFFANLPTSQLQQSQSDAPKERHEPAILEPTSAPPMMSTPNFSPVSAHSIAFPPPPEFPPGLC